jgi:hypothetical protein
MVNTILVILSEVGLSSNYSPQEYHLRRRAAGRIICKSFGSLQPIHVRQLYAVHFHLPHQLSQARCGAGVKKNAGGVDMNVASTPVILSAQPAPPELN